MKKPTCRGCSQETVCKDSVVSWIFFLIGIVSAFAVRVVTLLAHLDPVCGQIAWYVGVIGFFLFFVYKYRNLRRRTKIINKYNLRDKLSSQKELTPQEFQVTSQILCSLVSNKEKINYFIIFFVSAIALLVAGYLDFFS